VDEVLVENVVKDLVVDDLNVQGLEDEVDNGEESDSSTALGGTDLGGGSIDGGAAYLDVVAISGVVRNFVVEDIDGSDGTGNVSSNGDSCGDETGSTSELTSSTGDGRDTITLQNVDVVVVKVVVEDAVIGDGDIDNVKSAVDSDGDSSGNSTNSTSKLTSSTGDISGTASNVDVVPVDVVVEDRVILNVHLSDDSIEVGVNLEEMS